MDRRGVGDVEDDGGRERQARRARRADARGVVEAFVDDIELDLVDYVDGRGFDVDPHAGERVTARIVVAARHEQRQGERTDGAPWVDHG